jgi:hypothetical protein
MSMPVIPIAIWATVTKTIPIVPFSVMAIIAAIRSTVTETISMVSFAMMTVVPVIIFIFVLTRDGASEQYAAANGWWVCAAGRFNVAEAAYQTERGQLIARPVRKTFRATQNAGRSAVRSNPYI